MLNNCSKNCLDNDTLLHGLPRLTRLRFDLLTDGPLTLPEYAGSAMRGLLGHGLRKLACVTRTPSCDGCALRDTCVYSTLFETPSNHPPQQRYSYLPHPFVLWVDQPQGRSLQQGQSFSVEMTLMGQAERFLPYLVQAFSVAGRRGLGPEQVSFRLSSIQQESAPGRDDWQPVLSEQGALKALPPALPDVLSSSGLVRIELQTPFRQKRRGHLLTPNTFTFGDFLWALRERASHLQRYSTTGDTSIKEHLPDEYLAVDSQAEDLRWFDWQRYSSRQKSRMNMGGLIGEIHVDSAKMAEWLPLLHYGQWIHVGKTTSMGLGRYRLASLPATTSNRVIN